MPAVMLIVIKSNEQAKLSFMSQVNPDGKMPGERSRIRKNYVRIFCVFEFELERDASNAAVMLCLIQSSE